LGVVSAAADVGLGQAKPSATPSIEGVWKTISVVNTATGVTQKPPASIVIYTKNHFTIVETNNGRQFPPPAPPKVEGKLTDAEKLARYEDWAAVTVNSGTYEIKGNMLIRRPLLNKESPAPGAKTYPEAVRELKFEGNNTMLQIVRAADGKNTTTRTYTRLE
jgi:hypothetical protein